MASANDTWIKPFLHLLGLELECISQDTHTSEDSTWICLQTNASVIIIVSESKVQY